MGVASTVGGVVWAGLKRALLYGFLFGFLFALSAMAAYSWGATSGFMGFVPAVLFYPAYVIAGMACGWACGAASGVSGQVHALASLVNARLGPAMERWASRMISRRGEDRNWLEGGIPLQDLKELLSGERLLGGVVPKNAMTLWLARRAFDAAEVAVVNDIISECEKTGRDHITGADFETAMRSRLVDLATSQVRAQLAFAGYGMYAITAVVFASAWVLPLIRR